MEIQAIVDFDGGGMMQGDADQVWVKAVGIAGVALVSLVAGGWVGWKALRRYFVRQYYRGNYRPIWLAAERIGHHPTEHHLEDVPWIAVPEPLCQSTSLQMIAAQQGVERPRRHFDFLMGFTYGAGEIPGGLGFFPGTDPETGFVVAAPYLGLVRRYYVTGDEALYLDALRYYLAGGYAVRVGLDMGVLYDMDETLPHSDVLVGYDDGGFYYYETVCVPPAPCEPGQRPPGETGLYVGDQKLLDAVLAQAKLFYYPWRYSLSIFEAGPLERDLGPVWRRNGRSLIGGAKYGPRQGADVIEGLAARIENQGVEAGVSEMRPGLEVAAYVRRDNATYLREAHPGLADIERAAALFDRASADYKAALDAAGDGSVDQEQADQIATLLRDAAAAEREVGAVLIRQEINRRNS